MSTRKPPLRVLIALAAMIVALAGAISSASAQHTIGIAAFAFPKTPAPQKTPVSQKGDPGVLPTGPKKLDDPNAERQTFNGVIVQIIPPAASPNGFTLQLGNEVEVIRFMAKSMISGKSVEADVEGLVRGDYATVRAKRVNGTWYAVRVVYDVQPIAPYRILSGSVVRQSPDGRRVIVKLATGKGGFVFRITPQTRFLMDQRPLTTPLTTPLTITPGDVVDVLGRRDGTVWIAYDVNFHSTS